MSLEELAGVAWVQASCDGPLVGIGGTVRNLAAAAAAAAGKPSIGVQGALLERDALEALIERAGVAARRRARRSSTGSSPGAPG